MPEETQQIVSKRVHARFNLSGINLATAIFGNNSSIELRDISYSGFSVSKSFSRLASDDLVICFLDQKVQATAKLVHSANNISGFAFKHENVATLVFLQPILERMRIGSNLIKIDASALRHPYNDGTWTVLEGDGPTTLRLKYNGNSIEELFFSTTIGGLYNELKVTPSSINTRKQQDLAGDAPRMIESTTPDRAVVRASLFTIVALNENSIREALVPILKRLVVTVQSRDNR